MIYKQIEVPILTIETVLAQDKSFKLYTSDTACPFYAHLVSRLKAWTFLLITAIKTLAFVIDLNLAFYFSS
jgi:hypothetical protein